MAAVSAGSCASLEGLTDFIAELWRSSVARSAMIVLSIIDVSFQIGKQCRLLARTCTKPSPVGNDSSPINEFGLCC